MSQTSGTATAASIRWCDQSGHSLDWNGPINRPFQPFPSEANALPIIELLEAVVLRYPQRLAIKVGNVSMTYAELWTALMSRGEQIAAQTQPGDLVGILAPVSTAFPIGMLACLAAGRPFVALDPDSPPKWLSQVVEDARPWLQLMVHAGRATDGSIPGSLRTLDLDEVAPEGPTRWRPEHLGPDDPCCVLFTSGSTGEPKGVVNSQRCLLQRVGQSINAAHINCEDRFLTLSPQSTIVGVRDLITALLAGASIYLLDTPKFGAREILRIIRSHQISILFTFPALLRSVVENSETAAGDHLRLVRIGGDTTLWSDVRLLRAWMSHGTWIQLIYAATEAPMMQWFIGELAHEEEERIPIGYPLPGNELAVVDENGVSTPDGDVGELLVRSPYVALATWPPRRYVTESIQTDFSDRRMRILRTGDLVRRRPDGLYDRIGRKDRQLKIRGVRVELDGIEAVIRRHAFVQDVGVVARKSGKDAPIKLIAYVQPRAGAPEDLLNDLTHMIRKTLPTAMCPWRFYATAIIPRLPSSKLDARALHSIDQAKSSQEAECCLASSANIAIEKDPVELLVAHIWRNVLHLRLAARSDDFFDLGGDSIAAITLTLELERALNRELSIQLIIQAPVFITFCELLRENKPTVYSPLVVLKMGKQASPVFIVHGVGGSVMELFNIGRKISWHGSVIGIQARGLDGRDGPIKSIKAMTDLYLAAIKARQPEGPYFLCGYSFGGLVAFEIARRLVSAGDKVAFVGLIATLPPGRHLFRLWAWTAYLYRRLAGDLSDDPISDLEKTPRDPASGTPRALRAVAVSAMSASVVYRPGSYPGTLTVFEPGTRDLRLPSSASLWARHVGKLKQYKLEGRHDNILLAPNAEATASLITRCLEAASKDAAKSSQMSS